MAKIVEMKGSHSSVLVVLLPLLLVDLAIWTNATPSGHHHSHSQSLHQEPLDDDALSSKHFEEANEEDDDYDYAYYEDIDYEELQKAKQSFIDSWKGYFNGKIGNEEEESDESAHDVVKADHDLDEKHEKKNSHN